MNWNHRIIILLLLVLAAVTLSAQNSERESEVRLALWNKDWMDSVKHQLTSRDSDYGSAMAELMADADKAMKEGEYSVTSKSIIPPGGTKHDYMSMGPYWWPDPEKPDGLPYIRRDGEVNPERNTLDNVQMRKMISSVRSLTLAWYFSDHSEYAEKAVTLLDTWFLNPKTLMNPHLKYGQSIPGRTDGRFIGIIDTRSFAELVDAIALLESSGAMSSTQITGLRQWFEDYFLWLSESEFGKKEEDYINNHSVAYDVQACAIAYFLGKDAYIIQKVKEVPSRRIDHMIDRDGRQPHELIRTKAYSYSVSNLSNFFDVGTIGSNVGVDIFHYVNDKGGSIRKALDYLIEYIGRESDWPHEQINGWESTENRLGLLIRRSALIYNHEQYQALYKDVFKDRLKENWNILVYKAR